MRNRMGVLMQDHQIIIYCIGLIIVAVLSFFAGFYFKNKRDDKRLKNNIVNYFLAIIDRFAFYMEEFGVPKDYINESIEQALEEVDQELERKD
jgi:hypothetical protein